MTLDLTDAECAFLRTKVASDLFTYESYEALGKLRDTEPAGGRARLGFLRNLYDKLGGSKDVMLTILTGG